MPSKNSVKTFTPSISFETSFRSDDENLEQLSPPSGFAFSSEGHFIIADDFNHRIQIYKGHQLVKSFGEKGKNNGQFHYPKGIAVDKNNNIYVADSWNHRIQIFDSEGNHKKTFGLCGENKGELNEPYDIMIENTENILVVERYNHRLQWFSPEGKSIGSLGQRGTVLEENLAQLYETSANLFSIPAFEFPTSIDKDSQGNYYVTDSGNHRIIKFNKKWQRVLSFGERGIKLGQFQYPLCISVGPNDFLYVTDLNNNRIQIFSPFGQCLGTLKQTGNLVPLKAPCLIGVNPQGKLHVGLTFNSCIFQFSLPTESLEEVAHQNAKSDPTNPEWLMLQSELMKQSEEWQKATAYYEKAVQLISLDDEDNSIKAFDLNPIVDSSRSLHKNNDPLKNEDMILKALNIFSQRLMFSREEILNTYHAWEEAAREFSKNTLKKQLEILNRSEDPWHQQQHF